MNRSLAAVVLAAGLALATPAAAFNQIKIVEVFPGTAGSPNAQYVVLQAYAINQNLVSGHTVRVFNSAGTLLNTFTFAANLGNTANQAKILIATTEAATLFNVTSNLTMTAVIPLAGGKVCYDNTNIDCVAWGNYSPVDATVGTPFSISTCYGGGLRLGRALVRSLKGNSTLEGTDDTNDSLADFYLDLPAPQNNAGTAGVIPPSTCGNTVLEALEFCDDGNTSGGDGCNGNCSGTEVCGDCILDLEAGECCEPRFSPTCSAQCKTSTVPGEVSPPGSIEPLTFIDNNTFQWQSLASSGAFYYSVYRGAPPGLFVNDFGSCFESFLFDSTEVDTSTPATKQVFTYLVAGRDDLDCEGTLGNKSSGTPRPTLHPCP